MAPPPRASVPSYAGRSKKQPRLFEPYSAARARRRSICDQRPGIHRDHPRSDERRDTLRFVCWTTTSVGVLTVTHELGACASPSGPAAWPRGPAISVTETEPLVPHAGNHTDRWFDAQNPFGL